MRFDSYHPVINFLFFTMVIAASITWNQPVFLLLSWFCPFVYSVVLNGKRAVMFNLLLCLAAASFTFIYAYYTHFGITNLAENMIGNQITLESLCYGLSIGIRTASVMMWMSCVHSVISSDKVIYLFGRVCPKLSLFLSILLRMIPHIKAYARKVHIAQKCIGRGMNQGNLFRRISNFFRIQSIMITWAMENFVTVSDSMRSRGFTLRGRTAFSIYRFDNRDRSFVITLFFSCTILIMGMFLDQTKMYYNPELILNRITPLSYVFYGVYAFLCLLPLGLQIFEEIKLNHLRKKYSAINDKKGKVSKPL